MAQNAICFALGVLIGVVLASAANAPPFVAPLSQKSVLSTPTGRDRPR